MNYTDQDVKDLAYCGWMEARGDGISGCVAVMHSVVNRVHHPGFPKTVHTVIYQENAFSWTDPKNPEHGKQPEAGDQIYAACLAAAPGILAGGDTDPTKGAVYYENIATAEKGGWFARNISGPDGKGLPGHPVLAVIGHHTFYA